MVKTEAPAYAKAAGNSYSLHLPLARLSSTLQCTNGRGARGPRYAPLSTARAGGLHGYAVKPDGYARSQPSTGVPNYRRRSSGPLQRAVTYWSARVNVHP